MARPLAPRLAAVKSLRSGSGTHVRTTPLTVAVWTPPVAARSSRCHRPGPRLTYFPVRGISALRIARRDGIGRPGDSPDAGYRDLPAGGRWPVPSRNVSGRPSGCDSVKWLHRDG